MFCDFGKNYLLLAFRIGKHINGYVDTYFGPAKLFKLVDNEKKSSPKKLLTACKHLQSILEDQGFTKKRVNYLRKMLRAMETSIKLQNGNNIPYLEQVRRLYDIEPTLIDDSYFYQAAQNLKEAYQGTGTLEEKMKIIRKRRKIPKEKVVPIFQKSIVLVAERTKELFPNLLPTDENVSIKLVPSEFWGVKNCYLGNFKSRIEVNRDIPYYWTTIYRLTGHEGYPGHHTEHSLKELFLYQNEEMFEHCIYLIRTPQDVIREGIGDIAMNVLFSYGEGARRGFEALCPNPSEEDDIESLIKQWKAGYKAIGLRTNLSYHAHVDGWPEAELIEYGLQFGYYNKMELKHHLKFILNPLTATYSFCYTTGKQLIEKKFGEHPSPDNFKILLTQPVLPSDLI